MLTFSLTSTKGFFFVFFPHPRKQYSGASTHSLSVSVAVVSLRTENRKTFYPDININLSRRHGFQLTVPQGWFLHFIHFFEIIWADEASDLDIAVARDESHFLELWRFPHRAWEPGTPLFHSFQMVLFLLKMLLTSWPSIILPKEESARHEIIWILMSTPIVQCCCHLQWEWSYFNHLVLWKTGSSALISRHRNTKAWLY